MPGRRASTLCIVLAWAWGFTAHAENPPASLSGSAEPALHFTPGMARAMAKRFTQDTLIKRYELDPSKSDEVSEKMARRLMALAHQTNDQGVELFDFISNQIMVAEAEGRMSAGMPPDLQKGLAERMLPAVPMIRDLIRDVSGDVGPMLSFKQQLKLTGEVAMAGTAINAFEQNMKLWSKGQGNPFGDPFRTSDDETPKTLNKDGLSSEADRARKMAKSNAEMGEWREWKKYVVDAIKLYDFDPSQAASAESLLREYTQRAETAAADSGLKDQTYRNRLWWGLLLNTRSGWSTLLWMRLEEKAKELREPVAQLGKDFKARIDALPTAAQRAVADKKIRNWLAERGIRPPAETQP